MKSNTWAKTRNECVITLAAAMPSTVVPGKLPTRVKILNWGNNVNAKGAPVIVNDLLLKSMANPAYPFKVVALDFEHNTLPGTAAYAESKEPRDVAGYVALDVVPNDGVYMVIQTWTPLGVDKAHNYLDVSATPVTDKSGNVLGIASVALCRTGAVPGMEFKQVALSALLSTVNNQGDQIMRDKLIALLKLAPEATDDEIMAALETAMKAAPAPQPLSADVQTLVTDSVKAAVTPLNAEIDVFKKQLVQREKDLILTNARIEGKVVALNADAIGQLTVDALKQHVAALPVTVPLAAITPAHVPEGSVGTITDDQRQIALACGQDPDKVFGTQK
jgi:phage I-like protein